MLIFYCSIIFKRITRLPRNGCCRPCGLKNPSLLPRLLRCNGCNGSRNGFDEQRQSGEAAWNLGLLCGQTAADPRFEGQPTVTCSDNAAHHASRVDPEAVAQIPVLMFHDLLERRMFDDARLFDRWYRMVVDGRVKEKCREGFAEGGKSSTNGALYRYVLQLSVVGPEGTLLPLMHEEMDMHNPETDKEDCELKSFAHLSQRLKKEFPRLPICLVADSLYCCQAIVVACLLFAAPMPRPPKTATP